MVNRIEKGGGKGWGWKEENWNLGRKKKRDRSSRMEWNIGSILFPFYLGEVKKENIRSLLLKLIDIRGSDSRKKIEDG